MQEDKKRAQSSGVKPEANASYRGLQSLLPAPFLTPTLVLAAGALLIVAIGVAQRVGWISAEHAPVTNGASTDQVFTCAMHPQIRQRSPGRCPICGMVLVPATANIEDLDQYSVQIDPAQRRLANIATAEAKREPVSADIQTVGAIAIDESRMATIASYIDGRLERLYADYTGVDVAKGDHLAVIYSPELYSAQVEYLETRKALRQASATALSHCPLGTRKVGFKLTTTPR